MIYCQNSFNNLKRFWCHIHCSPDQEKYIGDIEYKDYHVKDKTINAITVNYALDMDDACGVYKSNHKIPLMQQLEQTKTIQGFFKFFGEGALGQTPLSPDDHHLEFVAIFSFTDQGLKIPVIGCEKVYDEGQTTDDFNYPINPSEICGCNICAESCKEIDWSKILKNTSIMNGFDQSIILGASILLLFTMLGLILNAVLRRKTREKANSVDSYEKIKGDLNNN